MALTFRPDTLDLYIHKEVPRAYRTLDPKPGDIVLDVGGQAGYFAAWAAGRGARVHSYEPEPSNQALWVDNTAGLESLTSLKGLALLRPTVNPVTTKVSLYLNGGTNTGAHSLFGTSRRDHVVVDGVSINHEVTAIPDLNKIKIDCEGGEYDILCPSAEIDWRWPDTVTDLVVEYHFGAKVFMGRAQLAHDRLLEQGFKVVIAPSLLKTSWTTLGAYRR